MQILDEAERLQLITGWNDLRGRPAPVTLAGLVQAQAASAPDAVAVACGVTQLTYGGLSGEANRLARLLARRGAGPETVVAVLMERWPGLVMALLAVAKAGAAFLPVDPATRPERIASCWPMRGRRQW